MISVIIPLYNKEAIIKRTLQSVLSQYYDDFEVIIVDDGSTDNSLNIVKENYSGNKKVRIITQQNGGPSMARNTGIKNAKGEWIVFLDADDELLPNALKTYISLATEHHDADIIDCGQNILTANGTSKMKHKLEGYSKNPLRDWYFHRIGPGSNHSLFKTSFIRQYPYNECIRRFEDAELLTRILQTAKVYSSKVITCLVHAEHASASKPRKDISEDFLGHLDMIKGGFWYRMNIFKVFVEEREHYSAECYRIYSGWYKRWDLMIMYKLLAIFR